MRLLFTLLLCLIVVGGTWVYLDIDSRTRVEAKEVFYPQARGITKVSIDRTFECFGNADFGEPAIRVTFGGEDVLLNTADSVSPQEPVEFELEAVEERGNALTVFANATSPDSFGDEGPPLRAMRVRITYDDKVVAEKMFSGDSLAVSLGGDIEFNIPATDSEGHVH